MAVLSEKKTNPFLINSGEDVGVFAGKYWKVCSFFREMKKCMVL